MKKIKLNSLQEKRKINQVKYLVIFAFILLSTALIMFGPQLNAQAQIDEQDEATEESTIQNIKKVIQDKQIELGQNEAEKELKQAYLAQVKRVSAETLTVLNNDTNIVIPLTEDLEIIKNDQEIEVEDIVVDDWIIVYSLLEEDNAVIKRLRITGKDFTQDDRMIMLGSITELYASNLLFDSRTGEENLSFLLDNDTQYFDINGDEIRLNSLYQELQCLIVAKKTNNNQWRASSIKALVDLSN
jgi:hypothetical protein